MRAPPLQPATPRRLHDTTYSPSLHPVALARQAFAPGGRAVPSVEDAGRLTPACRMAKHQPAPLAELSKSRPPNRRMRNGGRGRQGVGDERTRLR